MKKHHTHCSLILSVMKFSSLQILLLAILSGGVAASPKVCFAQTILDERISITLEGKKVKEVLTQIEKIVKVKFTYNPQSISINQRLSFDYRDQKLKDVLEWIFSPLGIQYELAGEYIILKKQMPGPDSNVKGQRDAFDDNMTSVIISGKVVDEKGEPLPGVSIMEKGTVNGTSSDLNGEYKLSVNKPSILIFSFIGYATQEVAVSEQTTIDIKLLPDVATLSEVVVVAFGKQNKSSMVSAAESINPKELKVPSSDLTTALAGRMAGVIAYQRSGEPGVDNVDFFIRGVTTFGYKKDPLIYIDGVETNKTELARLQPDDIASFSIMKDATASALYGSRGANGVILVTTKVGKEGPVKISVRYENSMSSNTKDIELADPVTYMKLRNESVLTRNPLGVLPYSQNKIDNTVAGLNQYAYPVTDWRKELIRQYTFNQRFNFSASGGGSIARYYIAGTYNIDNGILKVDHRNNFNSNIKLRSYQLRSNVSINMTKTTEVTVRLSGSFDDYNGPIDGGAGIYHKIMRSDPVSFPAYYPASDLPQVKHILFGNYKNETDSRYSFNPYADMVKGYKQSNKALMNAQFEIKQDLKFLAKGLAARVMVNTARYGYYEVNRSYSPYFYQAYGYNRNTDTYQLNVLNETGGNRGTEYLGYNEGLKDITSTSYLESTLSYNKNIGKHDVTGLLVYYMRNQVLANQGDLQRSLPYRNVGTSGRFSYAYDSKYMLELTFGYNGSERFYKTKRYGFFPAMGLGWMVSQERFWEPLKGVVNELKFRSTYGLVGNDAIGSPYDRFFYLSNVNMNDGSKGYRFGENFSTYKDGISIYRYANPDITWEIAKKFDIGFDLGLFENLQIQGDYFTEHRSNILMTRQDIPTSMGLAAEVRSNLGEAKSSGYDMSLTYNRRVNKDAWIQARGNFTYAHSEFVKYEEPQYKEQYKFHVGNSINQNYGFIAERLFVDDEEVKNSPKQNFGEVRGGDIKFRDVNGDGQITDLDKVPIGLPTVPEIVYGFGISAGYKGFDFSCFFQGSGRTSFWIDPFFTAPYVPAYYNGESQDYLAQNQLLKAYADSHWSEENRNLYAIWPRLSNYVVWNNVQTSTWFMRSGTFLRLKNVELGYTLPSALTDKMHMHSARIYANGTNLLLWSNFKLWDVEMGGNGLGYPIQRVINLGVLVGF